MHRPPDHAAIDRAGACAGFAFLEALMAAVLLAIAVLAVAGAFSSNLEATQQARRTASASRFLEQTMAAIDAQPYDNLLAMHGNVFYSSPQPADARFRVTLSVEQTGVATVKLVAVEHERGTGRELARLATYRTRR
jgi:Tfp pilus assembly protein PilV